MAACGTFRPDYPTNSDSTLWPRSLTRAQWLVGDVAGGEVGHGLGRYAADADLEVQVGGGGLPGGPDQRDRAASGHGVSDVHEDAVVFGVQVVGLHAAAVVDHDPVEVAGGAGTSGLDDHAVCCGVDGRAGSR